MSDQVGTNTININPDKELANLYLNKIAKLVSDYTNEAVYNIYHDIAKLYEKEGVALQSEFFYVVFESLKCLSDSANEIHSWSGLGDIFETVTNIISQQPGEMPLKDQNEIGAIWDKLYDRHIYKEFPEPLRLQDVKADIERTCRLLNITAPELTLNRPPKYSLSGRMP